MWHMASIGIGNSIGGVPRCGTWPASVSSSSGTEPSTRRMLWHGRRWRQRRRLPSMWHLASIGIGIGGIHRCGSWPASVSSSSGTLDTAHALAWPALASASTTSTRSPLLNTPRLCRGISSTNQRLSLLLEQSNRPGSRNKFFTESEMTECEREKGGGRVFLEEGKQHMPSTQVVRYPGPNRYRWRTWPRARAQVCP